jgi:hypothetical protein
MHTTATHGDDVVSVACIPATGSDVDLAAVIRLGPPSINAPWDGLTDDMTDDGRITDTDGCGGSDAVN